MILCLGEWYVCVKKSSASSYIFSYKYLKQKLKKKTKWKMKWKFSRCKCKVVKERKMFNWDGKREHEWETEKKEDIL